MKKEYVVLCDFLPLTKGRRDGGRVWDAYAKSEHDLLQSLQEQHAGIRLFEGPVSMDVYFEMAIPEKAGPAMKEKLDGSYVTQFAPLGDLLCALTKGGTGVLFKDGANIVSSSVVKKYGRDPKAKITIEELSNGKKNG